MAEVANETSQCCGGPSMDNQSACCVDDAQAKKAGEKGCGCGSSDDRKNAETVKSVGCCA